MTIIVHFTSKNMTRDSYAEALRRVEQAGQGTPSGRLHHTCYGAEGPLRVIEVWDTPESFRAFGATLMPILAELGVELEEPEISPVHNIIRG